METEGMDMRRNVFLLLLATLCAAAIAIYLVFGEFALPGGAQVGTAQQSHTTQVGSSGVWINEVMASNPDAIPDDRGQFSDWIEIYNNSDEEFDLSNFGVSDTEQQIKWLIPSGTRLSPKSYLIIYCSGTESEPGGAMHAPFKLKAGKGKESVVLTNASGQVIDLLPLPEVTKGASIGRMPENAGRWMEYAKPTPGFENSEAGRQAYEASMTNGDIPLVINEFQPCNESLFPGEKGDFPDWIEIYNPSTGAIDVSGFGLSDDRLSPLKWTFPAGTTIDAGGYLLVYADGSVDVNGQYKSLYADFGLDNYEESVVLTDKLGRVIDAIDYKGVPADASYGRDPISDAWDIYVHPTPGFRNDEAGYEEFTKSAQQLAFHSDLFISEIMLTNRTLAEDEGAFYDWVELHNAGSQAIDLSGYGLSDDAGNPGRWRFPDGTRIEPGAYQLMMASKTPIAEAKSESSPYIHLNFALSNTRGEIVTLYDKDGVLLDRIAALPQRDGASYGRGEPGGRYEYYPAPTPGEANGKGYRGYAPSPAFALPAGLYSGPQSISVAPPPGGVQVRYTIDGSEPTEESPDIGTGVSLDKTGVVRIRAFVGDPDVLPSRTETASYFIDSPHSKDLSIVSLSTDPKHFFDPETGIYVKGNKIAKDTPFPYVGANFNEDWERPVHVEIFGTDGTLQISQDAAIRIFGAYSRGRDQKGLALIARSEYGDKFFEYPIFDSRNMESYKSFVLRASGQDNTLTKIRDIVATSLVDGTTHLEVQAYRQAVAYLNGDYFGIYNIREKVTRYWVNAHYGYDLDKIDLLVGNGNERGVLSGDSKAYQDLIAFCEANDLSQKENYDAVAARVDIDNYIDYLIAEMYIANTDTGNIKFFRERSDDPERSKFRWIYYDFCWSLDSVSMDSYAYLTNPKGHGVGKALSTQLTRSLMQNKDFRNQFLRRFAELLNTIYQPDKVLARIAECKGRIADEIERDIERWPEPDPDGGVRTIRGWNSYIGRAEKFAKERPDYCIGFLRQHFELSESDATRIFGKPGILPKTTAPPAPAATPTPMLSEADGE